GCSSAPFHSSRGRHTRSKRDWSSDVCSSDLASWPPTLEVVLDHMQAALPPATVLLHPAPTSPALPPVEEVVDDGAARGLLQPDRSEERRVGTEGGWRWLADVCGGGLWELRRM